MSTPIRRVCRGVVDLPPVAAIKQLVDDGDHLVLRIDPLPDDPRFDERLVIDRLAPELPVSRVGSLGAAGPPRADH